MLWYKGSVERAGKKVTVYFYAHTNGKQTFFVQLDSDSEACMNEFHNFWNSLLVDTGEEEDGKLTRAKRRAVPATPAAPAPMM